MTLSSRAARCSRSGITALTAALALTLSGCATAAGSSSASRDPNTREWVQLFNGRDLSGWTPKFTKRPLGENYNNTFRAEDGLLKVRYDQWSGWNGEYGHLFYKDPYSYYLLAAEYRFVGGQVTGAPASLAWALRNNGLMLHAQAPETMTQDQDFPISIEVQLLGGLANGRPRSTANLCTPGTNFVRNDSLITAHCVNSSSQTYEGDQWVRVEVMMLGDSIVKHVVNGDTVMTYDKPQMGGGNASPLMPGIMQPGKLLDRGYITIQAESAEIDFRKIEILNLEGCTDPRARNYKTYIVKSNAAMCVY
ncbi:MAG: DUF1080 domain-containing protein [Gemmatimonadetes bacterium]|nr:DUF1080 domain-containing protein [Gemmatimonadota bacterium]